MKFHETSPNWSWCSRVRVIRHHLERFQKMSDSRKAHFLSDKRLCRMKASWCTGGFGFEFPKLPFREGHHSTSSRSHLHFAWSSADEWWDCVTWLSFINSTANSDGRALYTGSTLLKGQTSIHWRDRWDFGTFRGSSSLLSSTSLSRAMFFLYVYTCVRACVWAWNGVFLEMTSRIKGRRCRCVLYVCALICVHACVCSVVGRWCLIEIIIRRRTRCRQKLYLWHRGCSWSRKPELYA